MICANFVADAHLDSGAPEILLSSISRYPLLQIPARRPAKDISRASRESRLIAEDNQRNVVCDLTQWLTGNYTAKCLRAKVGDAKCAARCLTLRFTTSNSALALALTGKRT